MSNNYNIGNLDEESMRTLTHALELFIRLSTGEMNEIDRVMVRDFGRSDGIAEEKRALLEQLKNLYFPELRLHKGGYHAITSPEVPEQAKVMYDLYYSIRHQMDIASPLGKASGYRAEPLHISNKPLPSITKE